MLLYFTYQESQEFKESKSALHSTVALANEITISPGEDDITIANEYAAMHDTCYDSINIGEDFIKQILFSMVFSVPASVDGEMYMYRMLSQRFILIAKNFTDFRDLPSKLHNVLLRQNFYMMISLKGAISDRLNGLESLSFVLGAKDREIVTTVITEMVNSRSLKMEDFKAIGHKKRTPLLDKITDKATRERIHTLHKQVGEKVAFNPIVTKLLFYILLFSDDPENTTMSPEEKNKIERAQEKLIVVLQRFIQATFPERFSSAVFGRVMHSLADLKEICEITHTIQLNERTLV